MCLIVKHAVYFHIAAEVLFDSPGSSPPQSATAAAVPSSIFRGIDRAALLESLRSELSSSQLQHLFGSDPAADPLWSAAWLDQTGRRCDLPVVAEERSDDEGCGTFAGDVDDYDECSRERDVGVAGRVYGCDHCHCAVCKRSLESHECQHSISSSSEREVMTDDAGGTMVYSTIVFPLVLYIETFTITSYSLPFSVLSL